MVGEAHTPGGGGFEGFAAADFDAYEEKKWSSKKFTLERRRAKDKLAALARTLNETLGEDLAQLELQLSDEGPSMQNGNKVEAQLAFFLRGPEERRAIRTLVNTTNLGAGASALDIALHHEHACLLLQLDLRGLTISLDIAGRAKVDRDNAVEKLKQSWARERLRELARALPAGATIGFGSDRVIAADTDPGQVEAWATSFAKTGDPFRAERTIARNDAELGTAAVAEAVAVVLRAMVPLYRFLAWSRDNEHKQVKEAIKKTADDRQKKTAPLFQAGDRVTILSGLFAGRGGYLAEIDAKGRAKVMVGPVSVTVEVKDLKAS